jgi:hypothetical protein
MSPSDYVREYHQLVVNDTRLKLFATAHITGYQINASGEQANLLNALKAVLGLKKGIVLKENYGSFKFPAGDVMDPSEPFFWQGIRRAFGYKASPCEMKDVLRLAYRCGRIGKPSERDAAGQRPAAPTPETYARTFFSLDCNGLVGNYFGLSPEVLIDCWASISQKTEKKIIDTVNGHDRVAAIPGWNGWVRAAVKTLDYIPLTPRTKASEAKTGDVLITVKKDGTYKHIALVDFVGVLDDDTVNWRIVEWGWSTSEKSIGTPSDNHLKRFKTN